MAKLRGKALLKALEDAIKHLASQAADKEEQYIFNASELNRLTGISRVTIKKYETEIEEFLANVRARFRVRYGQAHVQALLDKIEYLTKDLRKLEKERNSILNHHIELYTLLYSKSFDMSGLIKPKLLTSNGKTGNCLLCGEKISERKQKDNSKVVQFERN